MSKIESVSIIIPIFNEESTIRYCLNSILSLSYPLDKIEVVLSDGGSNDNTSLVVNEFKNKLNIVTIDNKERYQNIGLNKALEFATGSIILRMDGHCSISSDYLSSAIEVLSAEESKYDAIGGRLHTRPQDSNAFFGPAIALALSTRFGVGNSLFRISNNEELREVDTVPFACYKKSVFDKIGLYHPKFKNSEDYEFHNRMINNNMKIGMLGAISSTYFCRSRLIDFIQHSFRNGRWSIIPMYISKSYIMSLRHMIPLMFVLSIISITFFSLFVFAEAVYLLFAELALYCSFLIYFSIFHLENHSIVVKLKLLIIYPMLHIFYGFGSLYELIKFPVYKFFRDE